MEIDDLIEFESENTRLDFKATQYTGRETEALIKDVPAMANADIEGSCVIILGVKDTPGGNREYLGIEQSAFIDPATYQQAIHSNIEPDLDVTYRPHAFKDVHVGVLEIALRVNQPYMMRKDFGSLRRGDMYIRKGTHNVRLARPDLESYLRKGPN